MYLSALLFPLSLLLTVVNGVGKELIMKFLPLQAIGN
ncbi:hypothetical protein SLEP1_g49907 [Rubroshorea leprosula]|uniref:Uncharacterized protein n=1 Tax=Rubroshorea leprosula TaxID=152421 RepID=A0AAV5LZ89_9ROSI|nr:hypothetical protein SLEP1_g49907 [Rubroshorea leprosula]